MTEPTATPMPSSEDSAVEEISKMWIASDYTTKEVEEALRYRQRGM
jgi:hypothetical protein